MRLMAVAVAAAFALSAASAAYAAPPHKRAVVRSNYVPGTVVIHRDEQGRTHTRIIVQKRSYLDGGTEVMPGDNIDTYRHTFLNHRAASDALNGNVITNPTGPIPDPFFLPGKDNPWPGFND